MLRIPNKSLVQLQSHDKADSLVLLEAAVFGVCAHMLILFVCEIGQVIDLKKPVFLPFSTPIILPLPTWSEIQQCYRRNRR